MGKNGRLPPEKGSRGERDAHGRLWKHLWYAMGSHHLPPTSAKSPNPTETGSPGRGDAGMSRWEYETGRSRGNQEDPSSAPERSRRGVRRCHRVCPRAVTAESGQDPCVSCSPVL